MPYNPGVENRAGEILGRSITGAADSISGGLLRFTQEKEKRDKEEKFKKGLVAALAPKFAEFGYGSKEEMLNDQADTILGRVQGQIAKQGVEQFFQQQEAAKQQAEAQKQAMAMQALQINQMREAATNRAGFNSGYLAQTAPPADLVPNMPGMAPGVGMAIGEAMRRASPAAGQPRQLSTEALTQLMAQNNQLTPEAVMHLAAMQPPKVNVQTGPGGEPIVTFGKSLSVGKPRPPSQINATPVYAGGKQVGYDIDGKFHDKDAVDGVPENAELEPAKDTTGKPIPGMYRDLKTGKIHKVSTNPFDALMQILNPGAAATPSVPAPAPARPAQTFTKGQRAFQDGKMYEFDGKVWKEVAAR